MSESAKEISLPAHLWDALDTMAKEMGVPRDGLVAQAVFMLARLNGYVVPGKAALTAAASVAVTGPAASAKPAPASKAMPAAPAPAAAKSKGRPAPAPEPEPEPEEEAPQDDVPEEDQGNPFEEQPEEEPAEDAPPEDEEPQEEEPPPEEEPEPAPPPRKGPPLTLTMSMPNHEPFKLTADSMIVGRGKHCDFVIDSNRVSREHVRITREGSDFVIEDLNSSNGTFYGPNKEKITRRKIKDGDEFTFGTEKVKLRIGR